MHGLLDLENLDLTLVLGWVGIIPNTPGGDLGRDLDIFFRNCSFLTLFLSMIFYWIQTAFSSPYHGKAFFFGAPAPKKSSAPLINSGAGLDPKAFDPFNSQKPYAGFSEYKMDAPPPQTPFASPTKGPKGSVLPTAAQIARDMPGGAWMHFGTITMIISNLLLIFLLIFRWKESGHFPLSNLYESLMFLSWSCTFIHLVIEFKTYASPFATPFAFGAPTPTKASPIGAFEWQGPLNPGSLTGGGFGLGQRPPGGGWNPFGPFGWGSKGGGVGNTVLGKEVYGGPDITIRPNALFFKSLIGSITSPIAFFTNAFATFNLPAEMQKASPLVPALQSNWLMMHVTVMIISYSALILGSLLSIAFLILISSPAFSPFAPPGLGQGPLTRGGTKNFLSIFSSSYKRDNNAFTSPNPLCPQGGKGGQEPLTPLGEQSMVPPSTHPPGVGKAAQSLNFSDFDSSQKPHPTNAPSTETNGFFPRQDKIIASSKALSEIAWNFDNLSYRVLGIGFPFLTIGILSGAVWANEAWGSYWSWDPKETWALLTWLIFAIYLHARITKGWQGKKPAIIASFGFLAIWICFLGVNLIGEGLHSYGWFSHSS